MKRNILITLSTLAVCVLVGPMAALAQAQRGGGTVALDPVAKEALLTALVGPDGEYAAQAEYTAILAKFGATVQPYANILLAERQHVAALQQQCTKFGVPIPADPYLGQVNPPATLLEAAQIGVFAELQNVAMYDTLLSKVQKYPSLVQVFTSLRAASLTKHLPAFEAAVANGGSVSATCTGTCPLAGTSGRASATAATGTCTGDKTGAKARLQDGSCQLQ
jgi:hypothetical protein